MPELRANYAESALLVSAEVTSVARPETLSRGCGTNVGEQDIVSGLAALATDADDIGPDDASRKLIPFGRNFSTAAFAAGGDAVVVVAADRRQSVIFDQLDRGVELAARSLTPGPQAEIRRRED